MVASSAENEIKGLINGGQGINVHEEQAVVCCFHTTFWWCP